VFDIIDLSFLSLSNMSLFFFSFFYLFSLVTFCAMSSITEETTPFLIIDIPTMHISLFVHCTLFHFLLNFHARNFLLSCVPYGLPFSCSLSPTLFCLAPCVYLVDNRWELFLSFSSKYGLVRETSDHRIKKHCVALHLQTIHKQSLLKNREKGQRKFDHA